MHCHIVFPTHLLDDIDDSRSGFDTEGSKESFGDTEAVDPASLSPTPPTTHFYGSCSFKTGVYPQVVAMITTFPGATIVPFDRAVERAKREADPTVKSPQEASLEASGAVKRNQEIPSSII